MAEQNDTASPQRQSPPAPEKYNKTESESESEEPMRTFKDDDHSVSEEESKQIEDDDDDDPRPPLLDMIDFPPSLTLPPTPPLPSSPRDFEMEQQGSDDDDGPPPGWDNKFQVKEQHLEQLVTLTAASAVSSDIQTQGVRPDTHSEEGEPQSQAHPCLPPEVAPSGIHMEEQDSEDDGPPPGWDTKFQPEPKLESSPQSGMKIDDVPQYAQKEEFQSTPEVPSDKIVDREDSEDEGPPPGWDSKCQPEPKIQKNSQPDSLDIKADYVQQDAWNETGPQSQSHSRCGPAPEVVPTDTKVEEEDLEDDGPPPGWNLKSQLQLNSQTACPATPPSDIKIEEDKEYARGNEGYPPGWGSTTQQQSHIHTSLATPIIQSGTGYEPNRVKIIEESPPPPLWQQPVHPIKPQMSAPKPPATMNYPEMGQMVCGSCRHLLSYPRGARYVECACCLEENYVLEEHEVGQVVCGGCNVLLMFPHGAPKVRCANCRAETEIGDQNRRPPLSEHKRLARQRLKRVLAS